MANVALPTNAVDLEGLGDLRRRAQHNDATALADVAVQFEALFIGMMLESARSASLGSGLFEKLHSYLLRGNGVSTADGHFLFWLVLRLLLVSSIGICILLLFN